MPKLLNINSYHYRRGGSDVVYFEHAALFADLGWETAFFSMHHPKNERSEWEQTFVNEIEFGHEYSFAQKVRMAGKVVYSLEAQRNLRRLLDSFRPDVAHLHCIYHHLSPSILPTLHKRGIPTVMTAHDLKLACPAYRMLTHDGICERCKTGSLSNVVRHRCIRGSLLASAVVFAESALHRWLNTYRSNLDRIITPSRFFLEKLVEWGWDREVLRYVPNYVEVDRFSPQYTPGRYFLYFGRLSEEKGVVTLAKAARAAKVNLVIAGTGPLEGMLSALTVSNDQVRLVGYKGGRELHQLVQECRAVVLPSEWYENAPMSILEAYALGKPVIGARIGGIPEMVEEGETGWLFDSGDIDALAATLSNVQSMTEVAIREAGARAREAVSLRFNRSEYLEGMLQLYQGLGVETVVA